MSKITTVKNLARFKGKRKTVLCHGCFDFLHLGHVLHLQEAKRYGELLIVTVTDDKNVGKGMGRPLFTGEERAEMLAALECVDYVAVNYDKTAIPVIMALKPDIYVKGQDYVDIACEEFKAVKAMGGKVVFTETIKFSTTELIEKVKYVR